ncbi:MAG TPA: PAS domain-containing protein, partial [Thermoanaerobaculia bacterium]
MKDAAPVDPALILRALGAATPDLIYVLTRDGRYSFVNEPAARVLGLEPAAMVGHTWAEIGLPLEREEEFATERERVLESGAASKREVSFPTPDGERTFEYVVTPIYSDTGSARGVVVISRDITERVAIERELRKELGLRHAIDRSLQPGLATLALDGRITWASASFVRMFGWSYDELIAFTPPYPLWPPEELDHIVPEFQRVMSEGGTPPPLELTFRRKNDERFRVSMQPSPLLDEEGVTIGWLAIVTDLTDRVRADQRYRDLADAMPQIVWSARADGTIDYYNKRWYELTRIEPGTAGDASLVSILHPADVQSARESWDAAVTARRHYEVEARLFDSRTNAYRWHLGRALPVFDGAGDAVRWYGTWTDIDEQKKAQAELVEGREELERQNFMLRTLLDLSEILTAERDVSKLLQSIADAAMMLADAEFASLEVDGMPRCHSGQPGEEAAQTIDVPVLSRSGKRIGRIVVGHSTAGRLTDEAIRLVAGVAAQAGTAIENTTLLEKLRLEDERYRTLIAATSQIVWSTDAAGTPGEAHAGMRELMGLTPAEWSEGAGFTRIHPADLPRFTEIWQEGIATGTPFASELRIRTDSPAYRWYSLRGVPLKTESGEVREWIGTTTDIDARKRDEEAASFLAEASALLTASLDPETILSRLAHLAVPRLADWCAIDVARENAPHERLIIAHPDQEKAAMITEVDRNYRLPPELDPIVNVLTTGRSQFIEDIDPAYLATFARDERHAEIIRALAIKSWILVPIVAGGRTYATLSLLQTDESGRRFSERDLAFVEDLASRVGVAVHNAALYVEAQAANRAKDEFLATLSHELRTPMTAIVGWARLLELGDYDPTLLPQAIGAIANGARAQAQLIEDLLDVSRIAAGKLHLTFADVAANVVVHAAVDAVAATAHAKELALQVHLDPNDPHIAADASRLQQVVWNLLNNAVKFTPRGGRIDVTVESSSTHARIRVADTGEGFTPDFVPHMFDRFRQADSTTTRRFGGLGLGLAIVRQITELHQGTVEA